MPVRNSRKATNVPWVFNPSGDWGQIRVWTGDDSAPWRAGGSLLVDPAGHRVQFTLNYQAQTARLAIDDQAYASARTDTGATPAAYPPVTTA